MGAAPRRNGAPGRVGGCWLGEGDMRQMWKSLMRKSFDQGTLGWSPLRADFRLGPATE